MEMLLRLEQAWQLSLDRVSVCGVERVPLGASQGRVLAEHVVAKSPLPPFDRSALDGYAVRAADLVGASTERPIELQVVEEVPAGTVATHAVASGQAVRIMTGAPIPSGADAIVRKEAAEEVDGTVRILLEVPRGEAISRQGEDAPAGAELLRAGRQIGAAEIALLATEGAETVLVYRRPRVGILVSGREVRPLADRLLPGQIRDSNGPMIAAMVREMGAEPVLYGQVGDELAEIVPLLNKAVAECDLVLTTGGVSVGDHDLMREAFVQAGGRLLFWKVLMRPGTPVAFAEIDQTPVYGLSGNPAAAFINYALLVQPLLRKLAGWEHVLHRPVKAYLECETTSGVIGMDRFLRAQLVSQEGRLVARVGKGQKAAILTSLAGIQGLVRIPARSEMRSGELVEVYLLREGAIGR